MDYALHHAENVVFQGVHLASKSLHPGITCNSEPRKHSMGGHMPIIRSTCLTIASKWQPPAPVEFQSLVEAVGKRFGGELSAQDVARLIGLGPEGAAIVSDWNDGRASIPYSCWAVLCEMGGLGLIWRVGDTPSLLNFN